MCFLCCNLQVGKTQVGDISPRKAEMRADLGSAMSDLNQLQVSSYSQWMAGMKVLTHRSVTSQILMSIISELQVGLVS